MAVLRKSKPKIDPGALYACCIAHASDHGTFTQGELVRGSNPAVAVAPDYFVPAGTPRSEWPSPFDSVLSEAERERAERNAKEKVATDAAAKLNKVTLTVPDVMVAKDTFIWWHDGRPAEIQKGSKALATDDLVLTMPEHWAVQK